MLDRTKPPKIKNILFPKIKNPSYKKLKNNVNFFSLEESCHDVIHITYVTNSNYYKEEKPGISYFTSQMLRGGTKSYKSSEIEDKLDFYGSTLEIQQMRDFCQIGIFSTTKYFNETISLLGDILFDSVFSNKYLSHLKDVQKNQLLYQNKRNNIVGMKKLNEIIFGKTHPYGRNLKLEDIEKINHEDLKNFYKKNFFIKPEIFLVGSVNNHIINEVTKTFSDGIFDEDNKKNITLFENSSLVQNIFIKREESLQESVFIGKKFPVKSDQDFLDLIILNELLGGYFGSRLMTSIREKSGYTYGIHSRIIPMMKNSLFYISSEVNLGKAAAVLKKVFEEIKKLQTTKIGKIELFNLQNYMKGKLLLSLDGTYSHMTSFINAHIFGLDNSYYANLYNRIQNIKPNDILEITNRYLNKNTLSQVVVGTENPF